MTLTRSRIRATAEAYLARHPHERTSLAALLSLLDGADDTTDRATLPGHVTCSAAVIDREQRVLHVGHKATGLLLTPGGHVERDRTLLAAALRAVCEETGLRPGDLCLTPQFLGSPIDIDVHDIDADPAKGEGAHQHVDFRFAFYLVSRRHPRLVPQDEEVSDARWLAFDDVRSPVLRAKLLDARDQGLDGRPEPVNASALIHDGHGRYLLHLRDQREGIWAPGTFALLGGGRTPEDTGPEATLRRELAEEVPGLTVDSLTPYALDEATSVDGLAVPIQVFEARWNGDPETVDLQEGVLLRWFTPDMLERLRLSPGLADLIHRHAAEHPPAGSPPPSARPLHDEAPEGTERLEAYTAGARLATHFRQPGDAIAYNPGADRLRLVPDVTGRSDPAGPDAGVTEFAERVVGRIKGWTDTSWVRENSRVWRVDGAQGGTWYVKVHQNERFHGREVRGLRTWAPALGAAAPRLMAADESLRAVVITAVPGRPLYGVVLPPAREREVFHRIGALARRIHQSCPARPAPVGLGPALAKAERHLAAARAHLQPGDEKFIRGLVAQAGHMEPLEWVETHGDFQLRNILCDLDAPAAADKVEDSGPFVAVIDLERSEPGPAVRDLVRLSDAWVSRPDLFEAFLTGYGRRLTPAEEARLVVDAALDSVSGIAFGAAHGDPELVERGRRTLARLRAEPHGSSLSPTGEAR